MCLHSTQKKAYYTKRNLEVYKIIQLRNNKYESPYQTFEYEKNQLYRTKLSFSVSAVSFDSTAARDRDRLIYNRIDHTTIAAGFHSICNINRFFGNDFNFWLFIITKAIIPKGSQL